MKCSSILMGLWTWPESARLGVKVGRFYLLGMLEVAGKNAPSGPLHSQTSPCGLSSSWKVLQSAQTHRPSFPLYCKHSLCKGKEHSGDSSCHHFSPWLGRYEHYPLPKHWEGSGLSLRLPQYLISFCKRSVLFHKSRADLWLLPPFGRLRGGLGWVWEPYWSYNNENTCILSKSFLS